MRSRQSPLDEGADYYWQQADRLEAFAARMKNVELARNIRRTAELYRKRSKVSDSSA